MWQEERDAAAQHWTEAVGPGSITEVDDGRYLENLAW